MRVPAIAVLVCAVAASPIAGQNPCFEGSTDGDPGCRFDAPRWAGELASLGANGLIGGLTAGFVRHFSGGSFADGFVRGFGGGAVTYAGKRLVAERFDGAGLLGRTLSAAGASMVRNAGEGRGALSRLILPLGPLWFGISRGNEPGITARVDPAALAWLVYGVVEPELHLDVGHSLSAGTAIFRTNGKLLSLGNDEVHAAGVTNAGIIYLADVPAYGEAFERRSLAHERVHVLQEDQLAILWTDPMAGWAVRNVSAVRVAGRFVAFNLSTELLRALGHAIPDHGDRPWELESIFFAR